MYSQWVPWRRGTCEGKGGGMTWSGPIFAQKPLQSWQESQQSPLVAHLNLRGRGLGSRRWPVSYSNSSGRGKREEEEKESSQSDPFMEKKQQFWLSKFSRSSHVSNWNWMIYFPPLGNAMVHKYGKLLFLFLACWSVRKFHTSLGWS